MKTDGKFILNTVPIILKSNNPIWIAATGDWHKYAPQHDAKKFTEFLKEAKQLKAYLLGLGDYYDLMSTSERSVITKSDLHDSTRKDLDAIVKSRVEETAQELKQYFGDRIIGMSGGNHFYQFLSGITCDEYLAMQLNTKYLGTCSITRLCFRSAKTTRMTKYDICTHHGQTGGRTCGSSINKLQQMANNFDVDCILQGHDHNRSVDYINRLKISNGGFFVNKKILLARTGSFLKSFEPGESSYAVDAAYAPGDLGGLFIKLTPVLEYKVHPETKKRTECYYINSEVVL